MNLDPVLFGNTIGNWLFAFGAATLTAITLYTVIGILRVRLVRVAARTTMYVDDVALEILRGTVVLFVFALALFSGMQFLTLGAKVEASLGNIIKIALLVQGVIWAQRALVAWLQRLLLSKQTDASATTTLTVAGFLARMALWTVGLLMVLDNLGFNITTLVTGLGIGGVAVALAVQGIVADLFASLVIATDKPFVIGDFIAAESVTGTVARLGVKTTRVRSIDGEEISVPNARLLSQYIHNYQRMIERRITFTLKISYETPVDKRERVSGIVRDVIESQPTTRFERAHCVRFTAASLEFDVVYHIPARTINDHLDAHHAVCLTLVQRFDAEGVKLGQ